MARNPTSAILAADIRRAAVDAPLGIGTLSVSASLSNYTVAGPPSGGYRFLFTFTFSVTTSLDRQRIGQLAATLFAPAQAPPARGLVADGSFILTADGECPWAWQLSGNQQIDAGNVTGSVFISCQKGSAYDPTATNAPTTWTTVSTTTATGASATLTLSGYSCFCGCGAAARGALNADKTYASFVNDTCSDTVPNPNFDPNAPPTGGYQPPLIKKPNARAGMISVTLGVTWDSGDTPLSWSSTSDGQGNNYPLPTYNTSGGTFTSTASDYDGYNHSLSSAPVPTPDDPADTPAQSGFNSVSFDPLTPFSFSGLKAAPYGTMSITSS